MTIEMLTSNGEEAKSEPRQLILAALEDRWKKYRVELKRCREEFSFEAVHDLRIATRRILAIIQLLNSIYPRPRLQKLERAFKDQLDLLDDLRDTQVILAESHEVIQEFPQLQGFQKHLRYMQEKILRTLRKEIKKLETSEVKKRIRKTHESMETEQIHDLESEIMRAVDNAYLIAKQRYDWIDLARPTSIHRVRIAFKSFRYMVEIVHPLLQGFAPETLKRMNDYQALMGEIQDVEVFVGTLADYSENVSLTDLEPVRRYYEQRHTEAISAYVEEMKQLDIFWRSAPDQPFPWEKTK
jgi:CHAD domain-containing protein